MNTEDRPDPDALLAAIRNEERRKLRGNLKIFFGMAAGVGKTYAMLRAARQGLSERVDVVAGYVETHGRPETEALLQGLPDIPRKKVEYRDSMFEEMDLDSILHRKPRVVLVDELAHTNIPGARHAKRYQDVTELLDAGIDVFTTLNVQHLESRADAVRQITGIAVRETVPDSVFDRADEIELVDITPDELLKRLAEGKVYVPEKAKLAAERFFRRGNLDALREMSLRLTAQHVDQQLRDYMQIHNIAGPSKSGERLLVAVGPSPMSAQLVRWTRGLAYALQCSWIALSVDIPHRSLSPEAKESEQKNMELARELGAEIVMTSDTDLVTGIVRVARQRNVARIIVGKSQDIPKRRLVRNASFISRLIKESGSIDVYVVASDKARMARFQWPRIAFSSGLRQYLYGSLTVVALAGVCYAALPLIGYQSVGPILLFAVVMLALFFGRGPVLLSAALSALIWDFFFIPPPFTFVIASPHDTLTLLMYFVVASVLGNLTARIRAQQSALERREEQAVALYKFARKVADARNVGEVLVSAVEELGLIFSAKVAVLLPDQGSSGSLQPHPASTLAIDEKDRSVAAWVWEFRKPAGRFTDTLPMAGAYFMPLFTSDQTVGVLGVRTLRAQPLSIEHRALLETFASQIASAIQRMMPFHQDEKVDRRGIEPQTY
jgi:two-component system, OmpR family, sensor histidine kinase KdpD